jgi:hypothetical protein
MIHDLLFFVLLFLRLLGLFDGFASSSGMLRFGPTSISIIHVILDLSIKYFYQLSVIPGLRVELEQILGRVPLNWTREETQITMRIA